MWWHLSVYLRKYVMVVEPLRLEKTSKINQSNPSPSPTVPTDTSLRATSPLFWNTSRDGDSTISLGSLWQCLTVLLEKKLPLTSNLTALNFHLSWVKALCLDSEWNVDPIEMQPLLLDLGLQIPVQLDLQLMRGKNCSQVIRTDCPSSTMYPRIIEW